MKKVIVALSLVLASGYVANTVYAAVPSVKSEVKKDGDKEKKKKKSSSCAADSKTAGKSCSSGTEGKSCCAGKK